MSAFNLKKEAQFGTIQAKLYSYTEKNNELSSYIKNKIQKPAKTFSDLLNSYAGDNINKEGLLATFTKLNTPNNTAVKAFDVKRSTVTEFMAEFLLEKEFQCIFFEQANKKLNKSVVDTDRHSTGVDVVGIQGNAQELKFIVAEVKASKEEKIPCTAAKNLKDDVKKILDFANNRLYREIFAMSDSLGNASNTFEKYSRFLLDLIEKKDASRLFVKRIIIFPFLIRNNPKILQHSNLNDFENFSELDTKQTETIGIVWAVNKNIDAFVKSIYPS